MSMVYLLGSLIFILFLIGIFYLDFKLHRAIKNNRLKRKIVKLSKEPEDELTNDEYDVIAGLHTLGYDKRLALRVVRQIDSHGITPEQLLRQALKLLQPKTSIPKTYRTHEPYNPIKINPSEIPEPLLRLIQRIREIPKEPEPILKPEIKPEIPKPTLKVKVKRPCQFQLLTKEDISDLKNLLSENIFKQFSYISLAWLKTKAIKQGIDDWISLIDSKLSYEENIENIRQQYGINLTDKEMMIQYERAEAMRRDFYQGIGENYEFNLSR